MKVLAIDPGYDRLGIAVLEGSASKPIVVESACVTPPKGDPASRLAYISRSITDALRAHTPDVVGLETLFFSLNKKTALGVAEARGVVLAAAGSTRTPVIECRPQDVKLAVTGYGNADKKAVANMVQKLVSLQQKPKRLDDEFDAIAIGITVLATHRLTNNPQVR